MVTAAVDRQKLVTPFSFEPLGAVQIERYRDTQCVTVSVAVCLDLNNSKRSKSYRGHKFRRSGVSQSEQFVTGGDRTMGATSLHRFMPASTVTPYPTHARLALRRDFW